MGNCGMARGIERLRPLGYKNFMAAGIRLNSGRWIVQGMAVEMRARWPLHGRQVAATSTWEKIILRPATEWKGVSGC